MDAIRSSGETRFMEINPRGLELFCEHRKKVMDLFKESNPEDMIA